MSKLSRTREDALIREAEESRDDGATAYRRVRARTTAETVVLSVRMPVERARQLRDIAEREETSLSELLERAVDALISATPPRLAVGASFTRVFVYSGIAAAAADTDDGDASLVSVLKPGVQFELLTA